MKKDIEWAKKEIGRLDTEESQYYPHNNMIEQEAVLGILNQLGKSEVLSQEWIDEHSHGARRSRYVWVDDLNELLPDTQ